MNGKAAYVALNFVQSYVCTSDMLWLRGLCSLNSLEQLFVSGQKVNDRNFKWWGGFIYTLHIKTVYLDTVGDCMCSDRYGMKLCSWNIAFGLHINETYFTREVMLISCICFMTGSDSQGPYTTPWLYVGCVASWCPIVILLLQVGRLHDPHIPPWRGNPCCPPSSAPFPDVRLEAARSSVPTFGHSSSLPSAQNRFLLDPWLYTRTGNVETWWTGGI